MTLRYVLFHAIGAHVVKQRAGAGDREAQFSLGYRFVSEADWVAGRKLGTSGRSPKADAGFALCTAQFPGLSPDCDASIDVATVDQTFICGCRPWAEEGTALLEQAAGQGHAYDMRAMGSMHDARNEHEQAVEWFTKIAEAGLPGAFYDLGCCLDHGKGVAPDYIGGILVQARGGRW